MFQKQESNNEKQYPLYILGARVDDVSLRQALERVEKELVQAANLNQRADPHPYEEGTQVNPPPYEGVAGGVAYITTPNPEICLYALKDEHYRRDILDKAFLAIPDGFGLKIAAWIFGERLRNRVTGVDFTEALMEQAAQTSARVFLFGGEEWVAKKCKKALEEKYRRLQIVGVMSGEIFNFQFSIFNKFSNDQSSFPHYEGGVGGVLLGKTQNQELVQVSNLNQRGKITNHQLPIINKIQNQNDQIIKIINASKPDIILVALGAPLQEYWIAENLAKLPSVKLAVGVGGTFDFISGKVRRAPRIMRAAGLEWFWRLIIQPRRLPRIFNATLKFLFTVLLWKVRMSFKYRRNVVGLIVRNNGGCSSVVECLLPKQKIAGSSPVTRSRTPLLTKEWAGEVLLVERADELGHWQLPQGGIDKGETPRDAICREMKEELGIDTLKIIKHIPRFYQYLWPKVDQLRRGYRGQKQDLFVCEFTGEDSGIHLDGREHRNFQWTPFKELAQTVHEIRKEQVKKAMELYCRHISKTI